MNKYRIKVNYYYYSGTLNAPKNKFLRDENGKIVEFEDRKEAEKHIKNNYNNYVIYYLNCGEYAPPKYKIYCFKK